jgi:hypothetical protein
MWKLTLCYGIYSKLPLVCHEELGDINVKHYCQDFLNDGSSSYNIGIPNSNPYFQPWIMLLLVYYTSGYPWPSVKSICFLFFVFSSGILGETKQNKSAKVAIFTEFVLGDRQKKTKQDFMKFLFFRLVFSQFSPSYDFLFFSFLFFFSKDFFLFLFYFLLLSSNRFKPKILNK